MKKLLAMGLMLLVSACASEPQPLPQPKETYPYGMTEKEWNELSIKDKARIRRDFYFYEKALSALSTRKWRSKAKRSCSLQYSQSGFGAQTNCRKIKKPLIRAVFYLFATSHIFFPTVGLLIKCDSLFQVFVHGFRVGVARLV